MVTRAQTLIGMALVGSVFLAGCTPSDSPAPAPSTTPTRPPGAETTFNVPDLGPSPAPDHLPDERLEQLRLEKQDNDWRAVVHEFPQAVRPLVAFESYTEEEAYLDALHACYTASGLRLSMKVNEIGETVVNDADVSSAAHSLARFTCRATVTLKPEPWNEAQVGYHYDYLTEFLAPCYAANGVENPKAPTREDYIANWPNPGWMPAMGDLFATPDAAAIIAACPGPFE